MTILKTYPFNLAKCLLGEEEALKIYLPGMEQAIDTLTEREARIVRKRFDDLWTLQAIANEEGVGRERIRQIEAKALRKLRHPTRRILFKAVPYTEVIAFWNDYDKLKVAHDHLTEAYRILGNKPVEEVIKENDVLQKRIDELELSVRSYNCLRRAGKNTIGDIAEMTIDELKKVRNLGRKSMEEVMAHLNRYGLELKTEGD